MNWQDVIKGKDWIFSDKMTKLQDGTSIEYLLSPSLEKYTASRPRSKNLQTDEILKLVEDYKHILCTCVFLVAHFSNQNTYEMAPWLVQIIQKCF